MPADSRSSCAARLESAAAALAQFRHAEAVTACTSALRLPRLAPADEAGARLLLAEALTSLARNAEALETLAPLLAAARSAQLAPEQQARLALRAAAAHAPADPDQGLAFAQEAARLAEVHSLTDFAGDCAFQLGSLARRVGETLLARDYFRQAQQAHSCAGQREAFIRDQIALAALAALEGDALAAEAAFDRAGKLLSGSASPPLIEGLLLTGRGSLAQWRGRLEESIALGEAALAAFDRAGLPRQSLLARSNLAHALLQTGRLREAAALMQATLAGARGIGDREIEAATLNNLGELRLTQGRLAEAERLIRRSLAVFRRLRLRHVEAQALGNLGHCLLAATRYEAAAEAFRAALTHAVRLGDQRGACAAWLSLAATRFAQGREADGAALLAQARAALATPGGSSLLPLLGQLRRLEGTLALRAGDYTEAQWRFEQAVSLSTLTGRRAALGAAWLGLARACQETGDRARRETALNEAAAQFTLLEAAPQMAELKVLRAQPVAAAPERSATERLATALTRLLAAGAARELLLRELARLLAEEFSAAPVVICEQRQGRLTLLERAGCTETEAEKLRARMQRSHTDDDQARLRLDIDGGAEDLLVLSCRAVNRETAGLSGLCARQTAVLLEGLHLRCMLAKRAAQAAEGLADSPEQLPLQPSARSPHPAAAAAAPVVISQSAGMRQALAQARAIRSSDINVLLTGETGTGKEVLAREIHRQSVRSEKPFIACNCAALSQELAGSLLFGHRKGAFTGAHAASAGVIGEAEGGTLLLDEIGELPLTVQPQLLRFLERGEVRGVGETKVRQADVRVIAATNRDLGGMVEEGRFRADLYYRLSVIRLRLPPLRERREEIVPLAEHYLAHFQAKYGKEGIRLSPEAVERLLEYDWPGNVRELVNELERVVVLSVSGSRITAAALLPGVEPGAASAASRTDQALLARGLSETEMPPRRPRSPTAATRTLEAATKEFQRALIREALVETQGNLSQAAQRLAVSRKWLRGMLRPESGETTD